jgi:hypothetical protein
MENASKTIFEQTSLVQMSSLLIQADDILCGTPQNAAQNLYTSQIPNAKYLVYIY